MKPAFTLIEMLVVMAIFGIITGLVLANHSRFNSSVVLGSVAYDIALSIREAQVYGLSVETFSNNNFNVGYGIHFDSVTTYLLFADNNSNKRYDACAPLQDPSTCDLMIKKYSLGLGHSFTNGCVYNAGGQSVCSTTPGNPLTFVDIVFLRPDPDANFTSNIPGYTSAAKLTIGSPSGETRSVTIASTGQISVTKP